MTDLPKIIDLASLADAYAAGLTLDAMVDAVSRRIAAGDPAAFITPASRQQLTLQARALEARSPVPGSLPLWGVPVAVKDNIDVTGFPTTAACPTSPIRRIRTPMWWPGCGRPARSSSARRT